jgi:hypothetical protein
MPIDLTIREAQSKTKKRFTAIFRIHKKGKVIKITTSDNVILSMGLI